MKIHKMEAKGIGRLHEQTGLPTEQLDGDEVVAICGLNGAGKTTLIECIPGLLYGSVPSHGLLAGLANRPDSFVEGVVETDQAYRLRRTVNATRKTPKIEAYLFDANGTPLNDGKQTTFAAEVAKRFPSERVYLASGFAAQGRGGQFLSASKADRKALFAEMLGLAHLQELASMAKERARATSEQWSELSGRVAALKPLAEKIVDIARELDQAKASAEDASKRYERIEAEARASASEMGAWRVRMNVLDDAERDASMALVRAEHAKREADTELRRIRGAIQANDAAQDDLRARLERRPALIEDLRNVDGSVLRIEELEKQKHARLSAEHALRERTERLKNAEAAAQRDLQAAHRLGDVPCHGEGEFASCPLITNATAALSRADENAKRVSDARDAVDAAREELIAMQEADDATIAALRADAKRQAQLKAELLALEDANDRLAEYGVQAADIGDELDLAVAAVAESDRALDSARGGLDAIRLEVDDHAKAEPAEYSKAALDSALADRHQANVEVERLRERYQHASDAADEIDGVGDRLQAMSADIDDWTHLAKALGVDGIQALEIDAAGPEVSDLINELLHSCYGPRFSCTLQTTALKKDGKGTKEVFDLNVIDAEMGTDGSAGDLSGGERVIVAEALSLAIAIYNARQSSVPILDLFRDECAGALDYEKAPLYVAMLRRALQLGGFHRVYFIAHQRELWELADARVMVTDGVAEVQ